MLSQLILNFCVLVTLMYLLSLTYRSAQDFTPHLQPLRVAGLALASIGMMLHPAEVVPGIIIDMRVVPIAYLALRGGVLAGVLGALPVMLYRVSLGGAGVGSAVFGLLGVALIGGLLSRSTPLFGSGFSWRSAWWKLLLVFLPNGLLLPLVQGNPAMLLKRLTVSVGITRRTTSDVAQCFEQADAALYAAKTGGRNRVVVWSSELGTAAEA